MELSPREKDQLRARYEVWGLEGVRAELARDERDQITPKEVVAFAREWVAAAEAKRSRMIRSIKIISIGVFVVFVGTVTAVLVM